MKIGLRLLLLFLVVSIIPILVLSVVHYENAEKQIIKQTFQRLNTSAMLVESHIQSEIENQFLILDMSTSRVLLRTSLENFNLMRNSDDQETMNHIIDQALLQVSNLDNIYILNNENTIVSSTNRESIGKNILEITLTEESIESKKLHFLLIDRDYHVDSNLHIQLLSPLFSDNGKRIGSMILEFDAKGVFVANIELSLGETGEYVIAKRDVNGDSLFLTPLKFETDASLKKTISKDRLDVPITQALLKNEQSFENVLDYREKPVFAVTKYLENMDWGVVVKIDQEEALLPIQNLKNLTYLAIIGTIALSILASIIFAKSLSRPILQVRETTKEIAKGNFSVKLTPRGSDEIKELSNDINFMTKELERQKDALIKSERLSAIGQIISRITHDLKSPLTVMKLSLEMYQLKNKNQLDKRDTELIGRLNRGIFKIDRQIKDILDFVKTKPLKLSENNLNELLVNAIEFSLKSENIEIVMPENEYVLKCDGQKMESVFMNLLNNSIESMDDKGTITIQFLEDAHNIILEFTDSGPGIPEDMISKIFDPLVTTKHEGTGLGLLSCKNIVEQHGGTISVQNNPTKFTIRLPKS